MKYFYFLKLPVTICLTALLWFAIPLTAQTIHPTDPLHHDTQEPQASGFTIMTTWDGKYISEGRNNLAEGGLGSMLLEWNDHFDVGQIVLSSWIAESTQTDYSELNLGAAFVVPFEIWDMTLGYTFLNFDDDDSTDNELSAEFGTSVSDSVDLAAAFIYSTEAGGTFVELIASTEITRNVFTLTPYILLGLNAGYVADEHDGLNNLQMGLEISTELSDEFELGGYIAYTIGLDEEPGETLDDIVWVGLSVGWTN